MVIPILLLIFGLILLIKGGDYFVDGASGIARHLHIPELLIGATVVSVGTTLPEVMVSSGAALHIVLFCSLQRDRIQIKRGGLL